jgi:hypothetical protein
MQEGELAYLLLPARIAELKQPKCREKPTILVQLSTQYSEVRADAMGLISAKKAILR